METVNAKEGNDTMNTTTTHLTKVGNAYATTDLRYYVKRDACGYRLHDRETRAWWHLGRNKAEALAHAEEILTLKMQRTKMTIDITAEEATTTATSVCDADATQSLPWDTTLDLYAAGLWSSDADGCCCSVCGRDVPSQKHGVVLVGGGAIACLPGDAHLFEKFDGGAYLGVYPVGRECIKKIPAQYRYQFADR